MALAKLTKLPTERTHAPNLPFCHTMSLSRGSARVSLLEIFETRPLVLRGVATEQMWPVRFDRKPRCSWLRGAFYLSRPDKGRVLCRLYAG